MNAFDLACEVEAKAMLDVGPFLEAQAERWVRTDKGRLSRELQEKYGDAFVEMARGIVAVELKAEAENKHGNLFLETWSNRSRYTPGWIMKLDVDVLLYYFLAERYMVSVPYGKLRQWAFHMSRIYSYRERAQGKYEQKNDTWGRCVPIAVILDEVKGCREYQFDGPPGSYTPLGPRTQPAQQTSLLDSEAAA